MKTTKEYYTLLKESKEAAVIKLLESESKLTSEKYHILGKAYESNSNWENAIDAYTKSHNSRKNSKVNSIRRRCECFMRNQEWHKALTDANALFKLAGKELNTRDCKRLAMSQAACGQFKNASVTIDKFADKWKQENQSSKKNSSIILTAALPKSASTSLSFALAAATGFPKTNFLCRPSDSKFGGFGSSIPSKQALVNLKGFGIVNHCHLEPKNHVLNILKECPWVKVVLHVRHPKDVLLSTLDMLLRISSPWIVRANKNILSLDLSAQIDWMIKHHIPYQLTWLEKWLKVYDSGMGSVIYLSEFKNFLTEGQDKVAQQIAKKLNLVDINYVNTPKQLIGQNKLKGKGLLTKTNQLDILNTIPNGLKKRFNWS